MIALIVIITVFHLINIRVIHVLGGDIENTLGSYLLPIGSGTRTQIREPNTVVIPIYMSHGVRTEAASQKNSRRTTHIPERWPSRGIISGGRHIVPRPGD